MLEFKQIHTFVTNDKTADTTIKGPLSPMTAAEAITKSDDFKKIPMTGLYELETDDKELFTTNLHADDAPRTISIYCIELMFKHYVVFGDTGTGALPIILDLGDGQPTVAPAYTDFPWIKKPDNEEIFAALSKIPSAANRERYRKLTDDMCNDWFLKRGCGRLMIAKKAKNIDVTRIWYKMSVGEKRKVMKQYLK